MQENVKNCTLISHFASASGGLRLPDPLPGVAPGPYWGTSVPPDSLARPHTT